MQIWELKPTAGHEPQSSLFGSSGASLHTKALAVDAALVFVGSYNLDPRSTWLNCEQGVFVEDQELAEQLEKASASRASDERSWQVTLKDDKLSWSDGKETFDDDPHASGRRIPGLVRAHLSPRRAALSRVLYAPRAPEGA